MSPVPFLLKITDFGSSKVQVEQSNDEKNEEEPTVKEYLTYAYASKEQIDEEDASKFFDTWSLGCILFKICTGKEPFTGKNKKQVYENIKKSNHGGIPSERYS